MVGRIFLFFLLSAPVYALYDVEVGFIELKNWDGSIRLFEPDFRFAHVAAKVGDKWLHAHPLRGVEWVEQSELEKVGRLALRVTVSVARAMSWREIEPLIGRPYDKDFSWGDEGFYCSELVAKLLHIPPEPMHFDPGLWTPPYLALEGRPGISPGGVFRALASPDRANPAGCSVQTVIAP